MKKYFEILGLNEDASIDDVRENYKKLSNELAPTNNDYHLLKEAYENIINNFVSSNKGNKNTVKKSLKESKSRKIIFFYLFVFLLLISAPLITYFFFLEKLNIFEKNIRFIELKSQIENDENLILYRNRLNQYLDSNSFDHKRYNFNEKNNYVSSYYSTSLKDQVIIKDTTFNFFYNKKISYKVFKPNYFECLYNHAVNKFDYWILRNNTKSNYNLWIKRIRSDFQISEIELSNILDLINSSQKSSKDNYFSLIYPFKIKNIDSNINCKNCFQKEKFQEKFVLNYNAQKDIENFIEEYLKNKKITAKQSWLNKKSINSKIEEYKKNMNWKLRVKLNDKIKSSNLVNKQEMNFFYESKINPLIEEQVDNGIQNINYSFEIAEYNLEQVKQIVENVNFDYYKNNSLKTGAKPYSYCYGNNPYCSPPNGYTKCSFIEVLASSSSDVIVLIKENNRVFSHGYINAGGRFKFKVGNGNFQTFFYYGNGWNPKKYMNTSYCGDIKGGFIDDESLSKSGIERLKNSSITYTLHKVSNGNFIPKSSNKNEAF